MHFMYLHIFVNKMRLWAKLWPAVQSLAPLCSSIYRLLASFPSVPWRNGTSCSEFITLGSTSLILTVMLTMQILCASWKSMLTMPIELSEEIKSP